MKLLLDTHAYLWWLSDSGQLATDARIAIANPRNFVFVSAASIIEIAMKQANGKLRVNEFPEDLLESCRFRELPLKIVHAAALRDLPLVHKDPFDRLLVAQARVEDMTLVSRDAVLSGYDVPILVA